MNNIPIKIKKLLEKYTVNEIINALKVRDYYIMHKRSIKKPVYTKKRIDNIIKKYDKKNKKKCLVICHGNIHDKNFKNALLLNRADIFKPDIVSNAW